MNKDIAYCVWLQSALGYSNNKSLRVYNIYESVRDFYDAGVNEWISSGMFTRSDLKRLSEHTLQSAEKTVEECVSSGIRIVSLWDDGYPELLRNIYDPPCVLYYKGSLDKNEGGIAIVGTRGASDDSIKMTENLAFCLAKRGLTIISGGAKGIDTAAHNGAIRAGGRCICVLGYGLNINYTKEKETTRKACEENGALVSEYPPRYPGSVYTFPQRNRIISGLSYGTVVTEASKKSGALITASQALEQGRDVFAVPGSLSDSNFEGTNFLIKNGAVPLTEPDDIIDYYFDSDGTPKAFAPRIVAPDRIIEHSADKKPGRSATGAKKRSEAETPENSAAQNDRGADIKETNMQTAREKPVPTVEEPDASDDAKLLYKIISLGKTDIDSLCINSGLGIVQIQCALTELEIKGYIVCLPGRIYDINRE